MSESDLSILLDCIFYIIGWYGFITFILLYIRYKSNGN